MVLTFQTDEKITGDPYKHQIIDLPVANARTDIECTK